MEDEQQKDEAEISGKEIHFGGKITSESQVFRELSYFLSHLSFFLLLVILMRMKKTSCCCLAGDETMPLMIWLLKLMSILGFR